MFSEGTLSNFNLTNNEEWKQSYKLMKEYEMLGFYLSGHPLEMHKHNYNNLLLKELINKIILL